MIKWENKFSVGISVIDDEHKKLINILNKAIFAKEHNDNIEETKEVLGQMLEYSQKHFSTEEAYMIKFNFPEYQFHKNEHLNFINKTITTFNKVIKGECHAANGIIVFLKRWLVNHIQNIDKKYIDCFKKNGLK